MKINEAAPGFWGGFRDELKKATNAKGAQDNQLGDRIRNLKKASDPIGKVPATNLPQQEPASAPAAPQAVAAPQSPAYDPIKRPAAWRKQEAERQAQADKTRAVAPGTYNAAVDAVNRGGTVGLMGRPGNTTPADLAAAAGTNAMKPGNTTVPPTKGNMYTVIDHAGRKFYMDKQEQWMEYQGQDWPAGIASGTASQRVSPAVVDQLAGLIANKKVTPTQVDVQKARAAQQAPGNRRR